MLDTNSRMMIANRMNEERLAEVRRAHILRESRIERPAYRAKAPVVASPGAVNRVLDGAVDAVRHLAQGPGHRAHPILR